MLLPNLLGFLLTLLLQYVAHFQNRNEFSTSIGIASLNFTILQVDEPNFLL